MQLNSVTTLCILVSIFLAIIGHASAARGRRLLQNPLNRTTILVEALTPKGLRVSIPNINGLQLFAFHGNINKRISRRENGALHEEIRQIEIENDRWIYWNDSVELYEGDVINYWILVQVNGQQWYEESLSQVITELIPREENRQQSGPSQTHEHEQSSHQNDCITQDLTTTHSASVQQYELENALTKLQTLQTKVDSLTELVEDLLKDTNTGTQLLLIGQQPPGKNPLESIRNIVTEKLNLYDLEGKILQANQTVNGIIFETSSPIDKKRILLRADKKLENSRYKITDARFQIDA